MKIVDYTQYWSGLYYLQKTEKTKILLHHTAGYDVYSSELWLRRLSSKSFRESGYYVGVHYFIDRDGTIIQTIPDDCWAWNSSTGNLSIDKSSISIELANLGYLSNDYKDLYNNVWTFKGNIGKFGSYSYTFRFLDSSWRGYSIYEEYSKKMLTSLYFLVNHLIAKYGIKKSIMSKNKFLPEESVYGEAAKFNGIITHCQLLGAKPHYIKWDLSIVFPYEEFVQAVNLNIV